MNKFYGLVGFEVPSNEPSAPGIWKAEIVKRHYYGDVNRNTSRRQSVKSPNDDLVLSNDISIVADAYAYENYQYIKFIEWNGAFWEVNSIEVQHPRLILSIGGVYNGKRGPEITPS